MMHTSALLEFAQDQYPPGFEPYGPMTNWMTGWSILAIALMVVAIFVFFAVLIQLRPTDGQPNQGRILLLTGTVTALITGGIATILLITNIGGLPIQERPFNDQDKKERAAEWIQERYQIDIMPEEITTFSSNIEFYVATLQDTVQFQRLAGDQLILVDPETEEELPRGLSEEQIAKILGNMMLEQSGIQEDSSEQPIGIPQEPHE